MGEVMMNTPLAQLAFAAIDFESAGAAPGETDCPVQVGIVRVARLFDENPLLFTSYIACEHPVRWSAARVHGITTESLHNAPTFTSLWPDLRRMLSDCCIVGHNPATEMRFLKAFPGHGFGPWLDTLVLARQAMPKLSNHSLSSVCGALQCVVEIDKMIPERRWHDALYDAAGSLCALRAIVQGLAMGNATLQQLDFAVTP